MKAALDWLRALPPVLASAIVAAIVALITSFITTVVAPALKYGYDKRLESKKVEIAYRSEQQKALRDHIARHKGLLLEAGETLNHRFWNFYDNEKNGWLNLGDIYFGDCGYYATSFAYRILTLLGIIRMVEKEALYIDATVATEADFNFLKAIKLNVLVWSDTELFASLPYDSGNATDHFFKGTLGGMTDRFFTDGRALSQAEFENSIQQESHPYAEMFRYLDGMCSGQKERYRFDRLIAAHLVLLATLNSFGYDYQLTSPKELEGVVLRCEHPKVLVNLEAMIRRLKLENDSGFRGLIQVLRSAKAPNVVITKRRTWSLPIHARR